LAIKYETSKKDRSPFVKVVTAVLIKFECLQISNSFVMVYSQEIHVLLLSAYANFLYLNYCLRKLDHTQHTGDAFPVYE
jgi:hypothetical protein